MLERKQKVIKEKHQRDLMLLEYDSKKKDDYRKEMLSEAEYLGKLKRDLELERTQ